MTGPQAQSRGAAAVGLLAELPPLEADAVTSLRHWFGGPETRNRLRAAFARKFAPEIAGAAYDSFGALCNFCVEHGRRPLMRHGMSCACLGADENCFANLVASAAGGDSEDALMLAALIVPPRMAAELARLATQSGLFLQGLSAAHPPRQTWRPGTAALH